MSSTAPSKKQITERLPRNHIYLLVVEKDL